MKKQTVHKNPESVLPHILKPGRYLDNEWGSVRKDWTHPSVKFALAYPDIYEIGMSNLGFRILYHILNSRKDTLCERVFSPWTDMEDQLRKECIPLCTLESQRPLRSFDVVGFCLQYELDYTNVINILKLSDIPSRAIDRTEEDPLIIGGGCCVLNPMPLSPFFDCFLIGEAEVFIPKIIPIVRSWRHHELRREELLGELSKIEGAWVPGYSSSAQRQFVPELKDEEYPSHPIVPFVEIKQDKLVTEISRGCTRGCRFCQAGIFYRPYRERSPESVLSLTKKGLTASGYREVSLLSLSASDHSCLTEIIHGISSLREGLIVTLPSLRGDSLNEYVAGLLAQGGITIAPETGSEKLRTIVNKDLADDDIMHSCELAARFGFTHIKLYYMIGLPGEDEKDIEAIVDLTHRIAQVAGGKLIKVAISPFVPKPHTPFQWEPQEGVEELTTKIAHVKHASTKKHVKVKYRDPKIALLEGVFSRGGDELSTALEEAWKRGLRFDGWSEHFSFENWLSVFDAMKIDPTGYLKPKSVSDPLPWDHIHSGVSKEFLLSEREKAYEKKHTQDCRIAGCHRCGMCETPRPVPLQNDPVPYTVMSPVRVRDRGRFKYRVAYSKGEALRYMGHLDLVRTILRTIERARIPIVYSEGVKPRPKVSFTAPIPLGMTSQEEYFDMTTRIPLSDPAIALARAAPRGMEIHRVDLIREPSVLSRIYRVARYRVCGLNISSTRADQFLRSSEIIYRERDIRAPVVGIEESDGELVVDMVVEHGRPWWVFEWLSGFPKEEIIKRKPTREWL